MSIYIGDYEFKLSTLAALALCIAHALTTAGETYQTHTVRHIEEIGILDAAPFILINYSIFLSPLLVLFLIRRSWVSVAIYAFPILIFFAFRMYDVWQFHQFGINSMARQKGDELGWFTLIFELISLAIAAPWLLGIIIWKSIERVRT